MHSSVVLNDGRVLITGGFGSSASLLSSEIYIPATQEFLQSGNLNTPRVANTITLLKNGKAVVIGGNNYGITAEQKASSPYMYGVPLASVEIFDPEANDRQGMFSYSGNMSQPRAGHSAALLDNGNILVTGGCYWDVANSKQIELNNAEIYNSSSQGFSPVSSTMSTARCGHSSIVLPDGRVLVAGGTSNGIALQSAEIFDPNTNVFSPVLSMIAPRSNHVAILLKDGNVLLMGGMQCPSGVCKPIADAEIFNSSDLSFKRVGSMNYPRYGFGVALLSDGIVLVTGGQISPSGNAPTQSTEIYDSRKQAFVSGPDLLDARKNHSVLQTGRQVLVMGGFNSSGYLSSVELYE
jgi:hypothetical protein